MVLHFLRNQYLWILKICKIEFGGESKLDGMELGVSEDFRSIRERPCERRDREKEFYWFFFFFWVFSSYVFYVECFYEGGREDDEEVE